MTRGELLDQLEAHRETCKHCHRGALCMVAEAMLKRMTEDIAEAMSPAPKRPPQS